MAAESVVGRSGALLAREAAGIKVADHDRASRGTERGGRGRVSRAAAALKRSGDGAVERSGPASPTDLEHGSAGSVVHPVIALQRRRGSGVWDDGGGAA